MKYLSVCSGIEAASVAWSELNWEPVAFSEIEPFSSTVLAYHYPNVLNWGNMTSYEEWSNEKVNVLVGGTPCQSFSVAGLREGLDDPRGNLLLTFLGIAEKYRPRFILWENVPGVLSSNGGRDFGSFLGALAKLGYGFAYRVLDAQNFGVPQRRRRVFVVACLGNWRGAAAVLFEPKSLHRCSPSGKKPTRKITSRSKRNFRIFHGSQTPITSDKALPVGRNNGTENCLCENGSVRRLTPLECERLQGFPDNYTNILYKGKPAYDGPRYKALGNSMAVPVMFWIGQRIQFVNNVLEN